MSIPLRSLPVGRKARIASVKADGELGRRIRDMGLVPGAEVEVIGRAPLRDPVALRLPGFTLSLRNKFRAGDVVEIVGPDCKPVSFPAPMMAQEDGTPLEEPRHPQMRFRMQLPQAVPPLSILRRAVDLSPGKN